MRFNLRLFPFILMALVILTILSSNLRAEPSAKDATAKKDATAQKAPEKDAWEFDQSLYTNDPKTGQRVWQYQKGKSAYHDPNSWFDSPHMAYPFNGNWMLQPYDVFPFPYAPGPNTEHPSNAPDPYKPELPGE